MQRLIRTSCAIAAEDLGKEKAEKIAEAAQRRYEELLNENAGDSKALRKHTFRRIYPAIAAYETFKSEGIEPDKAVWYIREYFQRFAASFIPHLKRVIRWFGLAKKVPKLFMNFSLKGFGPEAGFEYEFPETKGNEARFNMVRCPAFSKCFFRIIVEIQAPRKLVITVSATITKNIGQVNIFKYAARASSVR